MSKKIANELLTSMLDVSRIINKARHEALTKYVFYTGFTYRDNVWSLFEAWFNNTGEQAKIHRIKNVTGDGLMYGIEQVDSDETADENSLTAWVVYRVKTDLTSPWYMKIEYLDTDLDDGNVRAYEVERKTAQVVVWNEITDDAEAA